MYKVFKYRLYPSKEQESVFMQTAGCCRKVYNECLAASIKQREISGNFIFGRDLQKFCVPLKQEFPFLKEINSQSLQASAMNLAQAFKNCFIHKTSKFPKFKSRRDSKISFEVPQHFKIARNQIKLPKIGWVSCRMHRPLEGKAKSLTISKDVDAWFVSILCEIPDAVKTHDPTNTVGIDLGISVFAATSDGEFIEAPDFKNEYRKLKKAQRRHAKKQKGSKNREKARIKVARAHRKIRRINKNFIETTSAAIAKLYDVVSVEDLNIVGMKKNRRLSGAIQKLNWGDFVNCLERKVPVVHKVSRWFPSSQTCSCCGFKQKMPLKIRVYDCPSCGLHLDRDINAAINMLNKYKTDTRSGLACGEDIRLEVDSIRINEK